MLLYVCVYICIYTYIHIHISHPCIHTSIIRAAIKKVEGCCDHVVTKAAFIRKKKRKTVE